MFLLTCKLMQTLPTENDHNISHWFVGWTLNIHSNKHFKTTLKFLQEIINPITEWNTIIKHKVTQKFVICSINISLSMSGQQLSSGVVDQRR